METSTMLQIAEIRKLRAKAIRCIPNPSTILREIDKAEIKYIIEKNHKETGVCLPKMLRETLAKKYNYSEKLIERIAYGG
ncbi:hypothetical protein [Rhodohalobacter sulfatireducens]|uniref:Uncharacterized protein n=1 Tax=Rhodohalobacter sulfatireducens TaxID=2911366 RepID=A0ABS9KHS1_9BACT|nr:hypothetical protein [Rhodohalobacter sulfatireducens]MCG2590396.1 hypothetical protein [Rhodohalobacter sulfatireducens]